MQIRPTFLHSKLPPYPPQFPTLLTRNPFPQRVSKRNIGNVVFVLPIINGFVTLLNHTPPALPSADAYTEKDNESMGFFLPRLDFTMHGL
jgi:hypothetical protein